MEHRITQPIIKRKGEAGVSLIETAIAFMIIAIVLAFALPAVATSIRAYNIRSTASHIAERLTAARALAMAKNKNVTFSFNSAKRVYGFDFTPVGAPDGDPSGNGGQAEQDPDNPSQSYYVESVPTGMRLIFPNNANISVTFNSRGELPIGGVEHVIRLEDSGKSATVRVNLRGRITVE